MPIQLEVVHGDALDYRVDVLAMKFAQDLYGVDANPSLTSYRPFLLYFCLERSLII